MPSQADISGDADFLSLVRGYIKQSRNKPGNAYVGLVHRLDRPAGGVMVFARTSKAAMRLSTSMQQGAFDKRYLVVAEGVPAERAALEHYLLKDAQSNTVRAVPQGTPGAKRARLTYIRMAQQEGLVLLRIELETGRAHQIRVQCAASGLPIWGDHRYGTGGEGRQLALWAYYLAFPHPTTGQRLAFTAPPPQHPPWQDFARIIENTIEEERV